MNPLFDGLNASVLASGLYPWSVFVASLAGSFHCVGMCGGLMLAATHSSGRVHDSKAPHLSRWRVFGPQLAYHLSRGVSYVLLGALAGSLGQWVLSGATTLWLSRGAAVLVTFIFVRLGWQLIRGSTTKSWAGDFFSQIAHRFFPPVIRLPLLWRATMTGLMTGFLPCGWLYGFVLLAAMAPTPVHAGGILLAFWLGTLPALVMLNWGTHFAMSKKNIFSFLPFSTDLKKKVVGIFFVVLGLVTLGNKWRPMSDHGPMSQADKSEGRNESSSRDWTPREGSIPNLWICR